MKGKMKMKCSTIVLALVALTGCDDEFPVAERWRVKPIVGETLRAGYYAGEWIQHGWEKAPDLAIFKDRMLPQFCLYKRNYLTTEDRLCNPKTFWTNATYRIEDYCCGSGKAAIERYERDFPGQPYMINLSPRDFRSVVSHAEAEPDTDGFRRWREAHPAFMGFRAACEHDGALWGYFSGYAYKDKPEVQKALDGEFPHTTKGFPAQLAIFEKGLDRQTHKQFDCTDHYDIFSISPTWAQICARRGTRLLTFEADLCAVGAGWSAGAWFTRGAARQWDVPWCWYQASYMMTADRNGKEYGGMNEIRRKGREKVTELCGTSLSLFSRGWHYGWFAGASVIEPENYDHYFMVDGPQGPGTVLTKYGEEFNSVFELDRKVDRGIPYTPCAYLTSIDEPFTRYGPAYGRDGLSQNAFFWTLVPTRTGNCYSYREKGGEGCFWNSEFGEMGDVLCPDAGQKSADFLAALSTYRVAILVGAFNEERIDAAALAKYAQCGGRVYLNDDQLRMINRKLAKDGLAALKPSASVVIVPDFVDADFRKLNLPDYPGKQKLIASGEKTFPVVQDLMRKLQDELLPVKVEGDVQWGVNKVTGKKEKGKSNGWLVWMMNNKGVTKYACEEEVVDHAFDTEVKVTDKATGRIYTAKVPAGGWAYVIVL